MTIRKNREKQETFERRFDRLEEIVKNLESGSLALEDALKTYEEGVEISRRLLQQLDDAEKRISTLTLKGDKTTVEETPPPLQNSVDVEN